MTKHKVVLISLLVVEAMLVAIHAVLRTPSGASFEWHFWTALIVGVAVVGYAYSIRCPAPNCHKHQVFRGLSIFGLRWPAERCHSCGSALERNKRQVEP